MTFRADDRPGNSRCRREISACGYSENSWNSLQLRIDIKAILFSFNYIYH